MNCEETPREHTDDRDPNPIGDVSHGPTDVGSTQKQVPDSEDIVKAVNHVPILGDRITLAIII